MPNPVVHFEIMGGPGEKGKALQQFYRDAFGWEIDTNNPQDYGMVAAPQQGAGIGGGVGPADQGPYVSVFIEVADPEAALKTVEQHGGKTLVPVTEMEMVTFAMFSDPEGNTVGIVKAQPE